MAINAPGKTKHNEDEHPRLSPKLRVEQWDIRRLVGFPGNPRKNDGAVDRMCAAITEFGFRIPIVARSDGLIVDGHLRHKAALKLGLTTVPVALADELTETQVRAFRLTANQSANWAEWDVPLLKLELEFLRMENYSLELTGFDDMQLVQFMAGVPAGKDPEATPEPPATPVSKRGDIWLLGQHRLMCGDATSAEDVERLLDGAKPNLMVTDSPYGVDYDPNWRNEVDRANGKPYGARAVGEVTNDDQVDWYDAWKFFPGNVVYLWHAGRHASEVQDSIARAGFDVVCQIIWAKPRFVISRGDYHWQHEPCWYAVRKGKRHEWNGDRSQTTLWEIEHQKSETGHSTQKPIECMKRPIENNSQPGDAVYEPFSGSFTTGIACEITGRRCYAMEVAPQYVDMGALRWQQLTSKEARLDVPGNPTYAEVEADRAKPVRKRKRERATA